MDQGGIVGPIPITPEDKARLGVIRNQTLGRWKTVAIIGLVVAIIAIGVGTASLLIGKITMYSFGGPIITGVITLFIVSLMLGAVYEGRKYPEGDLTGGCFRCLVGCYLFTNIFCLIMCCIIALFTLIGVLKCFMEKTSEYDVSPCDVENSDSVKAITIFGEIVIVILVVLNCTGSCFYCCNTRAFGFKSRNEIMLEYQVQMLTEAQRQQGQQLLPQLVQPGSQPYTGMYQQPGYQPQQGQYYQPQQSQYAQPTWDSGNRPQRDHNGRFHDHQQQPAHREGQQHGTQYHQPHEPHSNQPHESQRHQRHHHSQPHDSNRDHGDRHTHSQARHKYENADLPPPSYEDIVDQTTV